MLPVPAVAFSFTLKYGIEKKTIIAEFHADAVPAPEKKLMRFRFLPFWPGLFLCNMTF
jgi:hypothetical protein